MLVSALGVFVVFASFDLPGPWDRITAALGLGVLLLSALRWQRQARVHRKPTGPELLWYFAAGAVLLVLCVAFQIAAAVLALSVDLPAQHTIAAAATALATAALAGPGRRTFRAVVRR
ncbi:hypothetical protein M8542_44415 [Amycolatopsis sp. OK19-0408]|uniref:Transmembrane protein n=1 Tax=Amycolatopsis iheyensis TaxID=2945988 RepID=A0A9X2SPG3_9PSEU|nr:hypothetical protein [Amycolatopsis iheyensis]MCR6489879.1 hypothetical protein [Amycolatopsis iheyensis]